MTVLNVTIHQFISGYGSSDFDYVINIKNVDMHNELSVEIQL